VLAAGDLHIWYRLTEGLSPEEMAECRSVLSGEERERCERFHFERDRRDFAVAHALLRRTLSRYDDRAPPEWTFAATGQGKPFIADPSSPLRFSLSHTRGLVACAVAVSAEVGIDVEPVDTARAHRDVAARYFARAENAGLDARPAEEYAARFAEIWTLKEAYVKALGSGLSHPLDTLSFSFEGDRGIRFEALGDAAPAHWRFALGVPTLAYRLAVAARWTARVPCRLALHDAAGANLSLQPVRQSFTG
jgi:4'-phosphopantetheinyl transferase